MRQRRLKDLDERLERFDSYFIKEPAGLKGNWARLFGERCGKFPEKIFFEVGVGKGKFICGNATAAPNSGFIGVEGQPSVSVVAAEKICENEIQNAIFVNDYLISAKDWFEDDEIDGVFLNFSDPWPKVRHEKRRLNHRDYLEGYYKVIKDGGFIKIKTDNDHLFSFGKKEAEALGYEIEEYTEDLHNSVYMEDNIKTEYEKKFSSKGKNINYMKIKVNK